MNRRRRRGLAPRGFTLAEVVVAGAGMLILGAVLLTVYRATLQAMSVVTATSMLTNQLQAAVEQIERDVRRARTRITAACGLYPAAQDVLILDAPGIGGAGIDRAIYQNNAGTLERILATASCTAPQTRQLATGVTILLFKPWPWPATTRYVETTLALQQNQVSPYTTSGKLIVRYQLRNK